MLVQLARDDPVEADAAPGARDLLEIENRIAAGIFTVDDWWGALRGRIELLQREASQVADWLHLMTGLVEPEPPPTL